MFKKSATVRELFSRPKRNIPFNSKTEWTLWLVPKILLYREAPVALLKARLVVKTGRRIFGLSCPTFKGHDVLPEEVQIYLVSSPTITGATPMTTTQSQIEAKLGVISLAIGRLRAGCEYDWDALEICNCGTLFSIAAPGSAATAQLDSDANGFTEWQKSFGRIRGWHYAIDAYERGYCRLTGERFDRILAFLSKGIISINEAESYSMKGFHSVDISTDIITVSIVLVGLLIALIVFSVFGLKQAQWIMAELVLSGQKGQQVFQSLDRLSLGRLPGEEGAVVASLKTGLPLVLREKLHARMLARESAKSKGRSSPAYYKARFSYFNLTIDILVNNWDALPGATKTEIWEKLRGFDSQSITEVSEVINSNRQIRVFPLILKFVKLILSHPREMFWSIIAIPSRFIAIKRDPVIFREYQEAAKRISLVFGAIQQSTSVHDVRFDKAALGLGEAGSVSVKASEEFLASMKNFGATREEQIKLNQPLLNRIREMQEEVLTDEELKDRQEEYALFKKVLADNRKLSKGL